jgi:uncharacterized protein YabE (DUF348 family)
MALSTERPRTADSPFHQVAALLRGWPWRLLIVLVSSILLLALALGGYQASVRTATLLVDGTPYTVRTHHLVVGAILTQAGLSIGPGDEVSPPFDAPWPPGQSIVVEHAVPVTVQVDGRSVHFQGRPRSILEILARAGTVLQPNDQILVNGTPVPESAYADESSLRTLLALQGASRHLAAPLPAVRAVQVDVIRAVPLYVHDDGADIEIRTTATTLGSALEEAGFRIYRADRVFPPLDTPLVPELHLYISRALPVRLTVDGRSYETRTWSRTVQELLQEEAVTLGPLDRVTPPLDTPLQSDTTVRIVRVTTFDLIVDNPIPYEHREEADPELELDNFRLQPGREGIRAEVTRITFEDGQEAFRQFLGEQVLREPVDQVFYYGTNIVLRTLDTPSGQVEYWRKLRVWGTHYYPATCDKSPDHPEYGITYTGKRATRGIIAVDPRVIPLHTRMYVPGYGLGAAEDIGGKIKGLHIDVCFDDADIGKGLWDTHYVDVYLLTPVPPLSRIPWILP